jgi:hypothetical protein
MHVNMKCWFGIWILLVLLATLCWQNHCHVRLLLYTGLPFYSESLDGNGLNMKSISVTSIKKAISGFHEDSAHVWNFRFLGRFYTRLSIYIITFCLSIDWDEIGVVGKLIKTTTTWMSGWPRKISGRINILVESECVRMIAKVREISKFLFRHGNS